MGRTPTVAVVVIVMVGIIIALDILVFRNHFWPRLLVNVGIVLVFGGFYLRYRG